MKYLSIFISPQPSKPIVVVDLTKPNRLTITDAIYYTNFQNGHAYLSNYKNIFTCKFDRRDDTGEIKLNDIPKRLEGDELLKKLEGLLTRGKDKKSRKMHPASIANLCPRRRFTRDDRPCKKRLLTDAQLDEANRLHESGLAWRVLGDRYRVNHDTLRLAIKKRGGKDQTPLH